jgi:ABC-type branched-subunit amino acid transport system substrate-binding protein
LPLSRIFEEAGARAARGVYVTIAGRPVDRLSPAGERFVREFGATRPGARVPTWAVYGAAATEALVDAIVRSDGTRESVARALATVKLRDSPAGPLEFDENGEPLSNPIAVVRADHGGEPSDGVTTAGGEIVDVIEPPRRLVGAPPGE